MEQNIEQSVKSTSQVHFKLKTSPSQTADDVELAIQEEAMDIFGSALEPFAVECEDIWLIMIDFRGTALEDEDPAYINEISEEFIEAVSYQLDAPWLAVDLDDAADEL